MTTSTWTWEGYWNVVLGASRTPAQVVTEFYLVEIDYLLDEWLCVAEVEALAAGGLAKAPPEWAEFRARTLQVLRAAIEEAA
jgi:hypothetical protein